MLLMNVGTILGSIAIILVIGGLSVLLMFSILREYRRNKHERSLMVSGLITEAEIKNIVNSYISRAGEMARFSMIYVDVDNFGELEKAFGLNELKHISEVIVERIRDRFPSTIKIGKLDRDVFLIFVASDISNVQALDLANRLKRDINQPLKIFAGDEIKIGASISVAHYPIHGLTYANLIRSLKLVTYIIKKQGGDLVKSYTTDLEGSEDSEYMEFYYQIRGALDRNEFVLFYEPIVQMSNGDLFQLEAVLRWNHPEYGLLRPKRFLNILEQSGEIYSLGLWILEEVIDTHFKINQNRLEHETFGLVINLSSKQLINETLTDDFIKIVKKKKFNPKEITLSINEIALYDSHVDIANNLLRLQKFGFRISISDVGIDFNTLSKIQTQEMNYLKFNSTFLSEYDENKSYMLDLLLAETVKTKVEVIAGKVDSHETYQILKDKKIKYAEGGYFSFAVPLMTISNYLQSELGFAEFIKTVNIEDDYKVEHSAKKQAEITTADAGIIKKFREKRRNKKRQDLIDKSK